MAASGIASGSLSLEAFFQEVVSTGQINPQTLETTLYAQGLIPTTIQLSNGTAAGQVDTPYWSAPSLAATPTTIDLTSLTDPGGGSIDFARVRFFMVYNPNTTAGHDVTVEQGASNGWSQIGTEVVRANGGFKILFDPQSTGSGNGMVVTGTSKTIKFDPGANTVTVFIVIVGGSVA